MAKKRRKNKKKNTFKEEQSLLEDKERLLRAIEKHKKTVVDPLKKYRDYYRGVQWEIDGRSKYNDKIVDNIVYGIVSSLMASLYLGNVKTSVKPKTSMVVINGKQADASVSAVRHKVLSDFLYTELNINDTMEMVLVDSFLGEAGYVFTGFEAKTAIVESAIKDEIEGEGDDDDEENDGQKLFNEIIESESLFVDRLSPNDLLKDVDVSDPNFKDSKRIYIRWVKEVSEVKEEYGIDVKPNAEIAHDKNDGRLSSISRGMTQSPEKNVWDRVEGYDIWDRDKQEIRTVVMDHPVYLKNEEEWPIDYKGEFPVDTLWFNYMPDSASPLSDTSLYKGRQDYINIIHSLIVEHVKKLSEQKYIYNSSKVKRPDAEEFARKGSGASLGVKGSPNDAWEVMDKGGVSQDMYIGVQKTKGDVLGMLGVSQFETGGQQDFNSASEARQESQGVLPKRAFRSDKYKKFIAKVITKLANVASQTLPSTEIPLNENAFEDLLKNKPQLLNGRKTGQQNDKGEDLIEVFPFTTIDKELLAGQFTFDVSIIDIGPESDAKNKQNSIILMQLSETQPLINKAEAVKVFFEAHGFTHLMDRLMRDPAEVAREQAADQEAKIAAQVAVDKPKRDTDLEKTKMKTLASLITTGMGADQKENEGNRKFITAKKDRESNEKVTGLDMLLSKARTNGDK